MTNQDTSFVKFEIPKDLKIKVVKTANDPNAGQGRLKPQQKINSWVVAVLESAVAMENLEEFTIGKSMAGKPVLVGAGFEIELNTDFVNAEELASFLNLGLNKADSDRIKSQF